MNENSKINKGKKEQRGDTSYSENMRVKQFCCTINLGFVLLISKVSLILKSNLKLALLIILKQRGLGKETTTFSLLVVML